jgi:hypothetical protein
MGSSHSAPEKSKKTDDIKKMFEKSEISPNNSETVKSDDLKDTEKGDKKEEKISDTIGSTLNLSSDTEKSADQHKDQHKGGSNNTSNKNRYSKYNIFNEINKAEKDFLGGFNSQSHSEVEHEQDKSNDKTVKHIRSIIMKELDNLNKESLAQLGGGCDCENGQDEEQKGGSIFISSSSSSAGSSSSTNFSSSDSSGVSRRKSKKNASKQSRSTKSKKSKKTKKEESSESIDEYEGNLVIQSDSEIRTSNNSHSEEGLSIFPFNSSDIKSSVSDTHQKILRRKL